MAYATKDELATYLDVDKTEIEGDVDRLLDRASDLIDYHTLNRIDTDDTDQEEAAKNAVCAQFEYWSEIGDELGIMQQIGQMSIGEFSFGGAESDSQANITRLAPRAKQYLMLEGLLYKGVSMT